MGESKLFQNLTYLTFFEWLEEYLPNEFTYDFCVPEADIQLKLLDVSWSLEEELLELPFFGSGKIFLLYSWSSSWIFLGLECLPSSFSILPKPYREHLYSDFHNLTYLLISHSWLYYHFYWSDADLFEYIMREFSIIWAHKSYWLYANSILISVMFARL